MEKFDYDNVPPRISNHKNNKERIEKGEKPTYVLPKTTKKYKDKLDILASYGFKDEAALLRNPRAALAVMKAETKTYSDMMYFLSAVFWVIGKQDFEKDPRAKPYYDEFQTVKKHSAYEDYKK